MVLSALGSARSKARDATRMQHMRAYQQALAMALNLDGEIPISDSAYIGSSEYDSASFKSMTINKGYLSSLPKDPIWHDGNNTYGYRYINRPDNSTVVLGNPNPNTYAIRFRLENPPASGSPYFCMTSVGIHQAGTKSGTSGDQCVQE